MNTPVFFATFYNELHWMYPVIKKTGWPVYPHSDICKEFCEKHNIPTVDERKAFTARKLVVCVMHYGEHQRVINHFKRSGGKVYVIQRAFDSSLAVYDEFWAMDMNSFDKYLVCSDFDVELLKPRRGDRIINTGSPRLSMAIQAKSRSLRSIYDKVGTDKFYVATVVGGLPIHEDDVPERYYNELPNISPYKIVYKLHPDAKIDIFKERYPDKLFWEDNRFDVWETYKLIAASQGVITPSSFMGIEATIMNKPVILLGDVSEQEYQRQAQQRQRERLPRNMSSGLANPIFTPIQKEIKKTYKYDRESLNRVVREIVKD